MLNELMSDCKAVLQYGLPDYKNINMNEVADKYIKSEGMDRDTYMSAIIVRCYPFINSMYKQNNKTGITEEDCYEIFLDALEYVLEKQVWHNPDHKLYEDKDAFMKCMAITTQSRKLNFIQAQNRQKRAADLFTTSYDHISDEFNEAYLGQWTDEYVQNQNKILNSKITKAFQSKKYEYAFILDAILCHNIFKYNADSNTTELDERALRKYLKNLSDEYCEFFATKFNVDLNEVLYSRKYLIDNKVDVLTKKIYNVLDELKYDADIINMVK